MEYKKCGFECQEDYGPLSGANIRLRVEIGRSLNDYDGDGKSDACLYQSVLGRWQEELSEEELGSP